jgi:hypothetical protein
MGYNPQPFGSAALRDPESDPMTANLRISVTVKINIAACLFGLAALPKLFL